MKKPRCCSLVFLSLVVLTLSNAVAQAQPAAPTLTLVAPRQLPSPPGQRPPASTPETTPAVPSPPTSTNNTPATPNPNPNPNPQQPSTPVSSPPVVTPPPDTQPSPSPSVPPTPSTPPTTSATSTISSPPARPSVTESQIVTSSTDAAGVPVEVTVTTQITLSTSSTSSAAPSSTSGAAKSGESSGLGTGSIVGLSVAGGVALIGIIGFIVWKLTRKRGFTDFDDNEAIKWPELNSHKEGGDTHPLPTNNTGRAGFETGGANLSRTPSTSSSAAHTQRSTIPSQYSNVYNTSTPDLYQDPYAVPPLPHLNPSQPYRDETGGGGAFYDPYRGPVPQALHDPDGPPTATLAPGGGPWEGGSEAIPMTQMAGRRSPGPGMAYDMGAGAGGRASPAPGAGRMSPGPGMAYGGAGGDPFGRRSPGPGQAYAVGRQSPGPYNAYGQ